MISFFPRALQPGATQKVHKFFLTLSVKQMHHPTKGYSGIDRRSVMGM